jgi:surface polysaccharide O-acyltransferase-like enzyme
MIYNSFGEKYYIKGIDNIYLSNFNVLVWPWFIPLLFVLAGMSTVYSLNNRNTIEYFKERFLKLFIPLFFCILLIVPCMGFFADKYHNEFAGNYFQHYVTFFTKFTDLTGYDGGFSPGHLWFVLYLLIISVVALPIIKIFEKVSIKKINIFFLLLVFIIPLCGTMVLDISGKSLGEYFCFYLIGYFLLSKDEILCEAEKYRYIIFSIFLAEMVFVFMVFNEIIYVNDLVYDIFAELYAYAGVLFLIIVGKRHLNTQNIISIYLTKSSFGVYIFHLLWIVIIAYFVINKIENIISQILLIFIMSIILTFGTYELCKRNGILRFMFGIKG